MSRLALASKARKHWEKWLPQKVADLKSRGEFQEAVQGAANLAQKEIDHLMSRGYQEHEAKEVALHRFILLPPEPGAGQPKWEKEELAAKEREYRANPPVTIGDEEE